MNAQAAAVGHHENECEIKGIPSYNIHLFEPFYSFEVYAFLVNLELDAKTPYRRKFQVACWKCNCVIVFYL